MTEGSCLCGAIRYRVQGPLRPVIACHCVQCRKTSGHFVAATSALKTDVRITGTPAWYRSSDGARRGFCATCGSNLFWELLDGERLSIHAGTFDTPTGVTLKGHIFVADKGDYYALDNALPQAAEDDPDLTTKW